MKSLPLQGVRILAFTQVGAGPYAMTLLGDLGAEIIKVEDPTTGGDEARRAPPFAIEGDSIYFQALNRNAKSITLNLRTAAGRALLQRLAAVVDVIYSNLRGDQPAKLGLDYQSLRHINPRLVCCSLSGFGKTGPRHAEPGYDYLAQALGGFMSVTGDPDAAPTRCGIPVVDFSTGLMSAVALLAGVMRARETGVGCDADVSLLDTAVSMLTYLAALNLNREYGIGRTADSAHHTLVPVQNFATRDGDIFVMCMKEKFWLRFCECIGLTALADEPRFRTFQDRLQHREQLIPLLKLRMLSKTTAEWLDVLRGQVPCAPVYSVEEALRDEQVLARNMVIDVDHPHFGRLREVGCPIKLDEFEPRYKAASVLGADTEDVLRQLLGLENADVEALRGQGAV